MDRVRKGGRGVAREEENRRKMDWEGGRVVEQKMEKGWGKWAVGDGGRLDRNGRGGRKDGKNRGEKMDGK